MMDLIKLCLKFSQNLPTVILVWQIPPKMATGAHGKQRSKARAVLLGELRPQKKAEVSPFKASKGLSLYLKGKFHVASEE